MIVSHANPRALYNHPRNIKDELIRTVAAKGGVIGVTSYALLNWKGDASHQPTLDDAVAAIDYIVDMVGIDHVGLGTDSEATEGAYPKEVTEELGRRHGSLSKAFKEALGDRTSMTDFRGMRDLPLLTDRLLQRGYKPDDVAKILGRNWLRIYETVWPA
jgi:membrane dipeptidase